MASVRKRTTDVRNRTVRTRNYAGSEMVNTDPSPMAEEAVMAPPCRVTICLQMLRPMPEPPVLVL